MSLSANRLMYRRPKPIQTNISRRKQLRRRSARVPSAQNVAENMTASAAARLARGRRRRYSTGGPRNQWPELNFARRFADDRASSHRCVRRTIIVRTPRVPMRRTDGTFWTPPLTPPPRGLSGPELDMWHRKRHLEELQGSQVMLWEMAHDRLGRVDDADAFVRALPLAGARSPTTSPTSMVPKRLFLRAVIHSQSNPPFGLKREFDLDALRETIPDPLHNSRSANFDREEWLAKVLPFSGSRRASWPAADSASTSKTSVADARKAAESDEPKSPVQAQGCQSLGVPINLEYARTSLPALAAIMMSDRVKRGDMIDLALPHPAAWPETVAYVYSGCVELLTDETKENVIYLGGKIGKKNDRYEELVYLPDTCRRWPPM